jgi:hypothetical protein
MEAQVFTTANDAVAVAPAVATPVNVDKVPIKFEYKYSTVIVKAGAIPIGQIDCSSVNAAKRCIEFLDKLVGVLNK